jgi:hypothetical protein
LGVPPDQLLALGRQDYMVRSVRMDTKAETWNATFSKLYLIPSGAPGSIKDALHEGRAAPAAPAGPGTGLRSAVNQGRCTLWAACEDATGQIRPAGSGVRF